MATKKTPAKKTTAVAAKKSAAPAKTPGKTAGKAAGGSKKMSKTELVRLMADKLELSTKQSMACLNLLAETALHETRTVGEFTIPGLGKLVKAERAARTGRNPQTGESIQIGAKTAVKFRIAKAAKDAITPPKK